MPGTISKEIVRLPAEYYGEGPTRAKTYIVEDLVGLRMAEQAIRGTSDARIPVPASLRDPLKPRCRAKAPRKHYPRVGYESAPMP